MFSRLAHMADEDSEDSDDSEGGRPAPVVVVPTQDEEEAPPPIPARPSFITNRDYAPSLIVFGIFCLLVCGVQWMAKVFPNVAFMAALVVLAFMCEWECRARFTFGRVRQRAHFDPLNLVKLPHLSTPFNVEVEPPTPFPKDRTEKDDRRDPAAVRKLAQDTISGGQTLEGPSPVEVALINLLKASLEETKSTPVANDDQDKKAAETSPKKEEPK